MRSFLTLLTAAVAALAAGQEPSLGSSLVSKMGSLQMEKNLTKEEELTAELQGLPRGGCGPKQVLKCTASITAAVLNCVKTITDPPAIVDCVKAGEDVKEECYPCICAVMNKIPNIPHCNNSVSLVGSFYLCLTIALVISH